ncbi:hypothetical protein K7X08_009016 [Anisodus acutangulus]|uniref:Uncharacterized protein n=1 Tax=Anisodus acutangulus TaxID=402998 RepID=A0A9Q1MZ04_9SOLA|nr:hypothetical protein K7X08_009016 [Anisodus acutangulus]
MDGLKQIKERPITRHGSENCSRRFLFDGSKIAELKDIFKENATTHEEIQPTRVALVTAVIWNALINVAQAKHGQLRPSLLSPAMNLRGRTAVVPISQNAFGNSWIPIIARFSPQGDKLEWFDLISLFSNAVKNTAKVIGKANSEEISLIGAGAFAEVHEEILRNNGVDVFICSSWSRFPVYEADFGWGRPCWVSCSSEDCEMFTLLDSKCGDGIEAWVCLNEKDMSEFELNTDICKFTSLF